MLQANSASASTFFAISVANSMAVSLKSTPVAFAPMRAQLMAFSQVALDV